MPRVYGRLGRLPVKAIAVNDLSHYLKQPLPDPPSSVSAPDLDYPMACNDQAGDCTIAGVVHADQATAALTGESWTYPGDEAVLTEYFQLTGGGDTGLPETDVLRTWRSSGLFGRKLAAFAPLAPKHTQTVQQAISLCGAVYVGVLVTREMLNQFKAGKPWSSMYPVSAPIGGHCVPYVGYNQTGPIAVTWGRLQQATWGWHHFWCDEAYAVITQEVKDRGVLRGVDFDQLESDLAALESS